ncbi:type II toxin-antitoxin system death-on-curing family toxin [Chromobacterium vaccinii]|uniref:type II toxin-antitoxin system death-on-curing family toxin n=1 Tax=Chromobacterium vaccinii TaxID=1108595 RepID=UPI0009F4846C|nr:type II toxin-antitoxin system death-on-curing family toxin [Chromobacterium vaccinii]
MWVPTVKNIEEIYFELVDMFEKEDDPISPFGVKSHDLLESACQRPYAGLGGVEKYDTVYLKVAALFHSLTKNHAFHNGNKRTALVSMLSVLYRNDKKFIAEVSDEMIYKFVLAVTANEFPEENHGLDVDGIVLEISRWIRSHTKTIGISSPGMVPSKFANGCKAAGAEVRLDGGRYKIANGLGRSISFRSGKKKLPAGVIRRYLTKLGIGESQTGIGYDDVLTGVSAERDQINRFMKALRQLAKT